MAFQKFDLDKYIGLGNYIEITCHENTGVQNAIDVVDALFFKVLHSFKAKNGSCFQKHYKEYVIRNMFYENNEKNQIKIYKKDLTKYEKFSNKIDIGVYHKEKMPYHLFPSSTFLYSICYVSKVIFKMNNRVFVNFEKRVYADTRLNYNKIYINYNHEENVDTTHINTCINKTLMQIQEMLS